MTQMQDDDLDGLLAHAAKQAMAPSPGLMERVLADALALQPATPAMIAAAPAPRASFFARLAAVFGGTPALAGLCSATVLGVAVGYLSPSTLDYLTGMGAEADTAEFFPEADFLTTEG
jgi:hypothetical protein